MLETLKGTTVEMTGGRPILFKGAQVLATFHGDHGLAELRAKQVGLAVKRAPELARMLKTLLAMTSNDGHFAAIAMPVVREQAQDLLDRIGIEEAHINREIA